MAYVEMWEIEVWHDGLNKYRHIRGSDRTVVNKKADAQLLQWEEMWEKKKAAEQRKNERESSIKDKEGKKQLAISKTREAEEAIY